MTEILTQGNPEQSEDDINREFQEMVARVLGEDAKADQEPLRQHIGNLPAGGIVIVPDPADLEPVRYVERTPDEERELTFLALRAVEAMRARRTDPED